MTAAASAAYEGGPAIPVPSSDSPCPRDDVGRDRSAPARGREFVDVRRSSEVTRLKNIERVVRWFIDKHGVRVQRPEMPAHVLKRRGGRRAALRGSLAASRGAIGLVAVAVSRDRCPHRAADVGGDRQLSAVRLAPWELMTNLRLTPGEYASGDPAATRAHHQGWQSAHLPVVDRSRPPRPAPPASACLHRPIRGRGAAPASSPARHAETRVFRPHRAPTQTGHRSTVAATAVARDVVGPVSAAMVGDSLGEPQPRMPWPDPASLTFAEVGQ